MRGKSRLLVFFALLGLLSCGTERSLVSGVSETEAYPPTFTEIRRRIIEPKCISCHESFVSYKELLSGYVVAGQPNASELLLEVEGEAMPPYGAKLIDAEVQAIRTWIANGANYD